MDDDNLKKKTISIYLFINISKVKERISAKS